MKNAILLLSLILCISCSDHKKPSSIETEIETESPFNPTLKKAIDEFVDFVEKTYDGAKVYRIMAYKDDEIPILFLHNSSFYFDWTKYYYIEGDRLFTYEDSDTTCLSGMIDINKMTVFRDSIPGFEDISKRDGIDDPDSRIYKIISQDSLQLTFTGLYKGQIDIKEYLNYDKEKIIRYYYSK